MVSARPMLELEEGLHANFGEQQPPRGRHFPELGNLHGRKEVVQPRVIKPWSVGEVKARGQHLPSEAAEQRS